MPEAAPLVLVSNRGPVTFDVDGSFTRGGGGRERRSRGLKAAVTARVPGDWIDDQLADIRSKQAATTA